MPSTPNPRSFQQILQSLKQIFVAKSGVNDLNPGSSINSFLEAAALSDFRNQADIIAALNSTDVDRAEGADLDNIGLGRGIKRPQAQAATAFVTLGSNNFEKISSKIYAGTAAPPSGSSTINVSDASAFPSTGSVYIGRGSNNVEGPIAYSGITQVGNYYQITLSTNTTKNHNVNESVVVAQGGNRVVTAGTIVQTAANATSASVKYRTLVNITIPDGEKEISDVPVICTELGTIGNQAAGSVKEFASDPFSSASVTNVLPIVTGKDSMADSDYRLLIKDFEQTKVKGTDLAIKSAAVGVTSTDDNKTVASAQIRKPANRGEPANLFVDDGSGYQVIYSGQGFEQVVDNANGGEKYLQLQNEDVTKALLRSSFTAPFALTGSMVLAVKVGGVLSEHTFSSSDFATQNAADTFEVVNSINANTSLLFNARAVENSKRIILFAKSFANEDVELASPSNPNAVSANDYLGFSENLTYSLRLYKNDQLLIKDGQIPTVYTLAQSSWLSMSGSHTLKIKLDKSVFVVYTFTDADFVEFGYATLSQNNSLDSWAGVINNKVAGVTATVEGSRIKLVSNKGANNNSYIGIEYQAGSDLSGKIFGLTGSVTLLEDQGRTSDYSFNRSTGQIELASPLVAGDVITAGSKNTRPFLDSSTISTGTISLTSSPAPKLWVLLDNDASLITSAADAGSTITVTNPASNRWRFTSSVSTAFSNVLVGDWMVVADDAMFALDPDFIGYWRVSAAAPSYVEFYMTTSLGTVGGPVTLLKNDKITFVRSEGSIQEITLLGGLNTLTAQANNINTQLVGAAASVIGGKVIRLTSNTYNLNGKIFIAGVTSSADPLGFASGQSDSSTVTHTAFAESQTSEVTMPSFVHDVIATGTATIPPLSITSTANLENLGIDPNQFMVFLDAFGRRSSNKRLYTQLQNLSGTAITLRSNPKLNDVIAGDRLYAAQPFNFSSDDNLVAILDSDSVNKSLNIKIARKGKVSSAQVPTQTQFKAYDSDAGPTANYPNQFGDNFDFKDFKIHLKARQILDPTGSNNKMLLRAAQFGPTGNETKFGIFYPAAPSAAITSFVDLKRNANIKLFLASGSERLGGNWDNTSQFDVTNPSGNTWRYTWNGIGTSPNFISGAAVAINDIVSISTSSLFSSDNLGIYKVTAINNIYFEITKYNGVVENNITLNGASDLRFWPLNASANKASDIKTYIDANLSSYIGVDQLQSGAGVVSTSTYDDNAGSSQFVSLVDGENWLLSSAIGTTISPTNQFNLKKPLSILESDPEYTLVGEDFYLIPTTADQIKRFLNKFAVTGLSSLGTLDVSSDAGKIQIASTLFGTSGSIQISGGSANSSEGAVTVSGVQVTQAVIRSIAWSGSTVTISFTENHELQVGDVITVSGVNTSHFNGEFTITAVTAKTLSYSATQPTISIASSPTGAVRSSNVVTITTTAAHGLSLNDYVTISGVTDASFNGTFQITSVPSGTTFTYSQVAANATSGSGSVTDIKSFGGVVGVKYGKISIDKANKAGLQAGQWIKVESTASQPKSIGLTSTSQIQLQINTPSVGKGTLTLTAPGSFQTARSHSGDNTTQIKVSKQGQFVCLSHTGTGTAPNFVGGGVKRGDWVRITGSFSLSNQGIFKVVQLFGSNSLYIENSLAVEEEILLSAATDLRFYSYDSVMPGDKLMIATDVLGASNAGTYTVLGDSDFPTATVLVVEPSFAANQAATSLGSASSLVTITEAHPFRSYNQIKNISLDPQDPSSYVIILDTDLLVNKVTVSSGAGMSGIGKFNFKTTVQSGEDSYKFYGGLISAVGKVIRGQASDPIGYPGVAAAGSYIEINPPLPKRIQLSIVVRNRTGVPFASIKSRVQSAVASYVNSLGVGDPVVFSEIISAVQDVSGVQAVSISSPTYNATNDQIVSQSDEKPLIFDLSTDVIVSLAT